MRRFMYSAALLIVVVLAIYIHGPAIKQEASAWVTQQRLRRNVDNAIRSTAYTVSPDGWIEFLLPPQTVALRVLTNAAVMQPDLPPDNPDRPRRGWRYAVRYQLRGDDHQLLNQQDYHLRTRITQYQDPETGKIQGVTWFRDSNKIPTQTRTIQLPLNGNEGRPTMIRLRLADSDVEIVEVVARVYIKYERPNYEQPYMWSRLTARRRERLARASVYPADLLSPAERKNLMRWNWAAIPPLGRVDLDYVQRQMYQQEDPQPDAAEFLPSADGIACRPGFPVTIPIPAQPGHVKLNFVCAESDAEADEATVSIRYYRPVHGLVWEEQTKAESGTTFQRPTIGGVCEVVASAKTICSARWVADASDESVATETRLVASVDTLTEVDDAISEPVVLESSYQRVRHHIATRDQQLHYTITHVGDQIAPVKFRVRRLVMPDIDEVGRTIWPTRLEKGQLHFAWLDAEGQVLHTGTVETSELITPYDSAAMGTSTLATTEPVAVYFALPKEVASVHLSSQHEDIAVAAFTRPPGMPRTFRLPEQGDDYLMQEEVGRTWFLLRPDNYEHRIMANRFANLRSQMRPPEANELLTTGEFEWEDIAPSAQPPGRFVLTQRDPQLAVRERTRGLIYHALNANQDVAIRWQVDDAESALTPRLVYRAEKFSDTPIEVWLDEKLFHRFQPRATCGEIDLPQVTAATADLLHRLRVVSDLPIEFWIRGVTTVDPLPQNLKRFVYQIDDQPLEFPVLKRTAGIEHIIVRPFFSRKESAVPARNAPSDRRRQSIEINVLGVSARPPGPLPSWTLTNRAFDILPADQPPALMLGGTDRTVDQGQRCLVVLGEDLPAGEYRLRVQWLTASASDQPAYVSVYRLLPPQPAKRTMTIDAWSTEMASIESGRLHID